jgi:hypothetical protein
LIPTSIVSPSLRNPFISNFCFLFHKHLSFLRVYYNILLFISQAFVD